MFTCGYSINGHECKQRFHNLTNLADHLINGHNLEPYEVGTIIPSLEGELDEQFVA